MKTLKQWHESGLDLDEFLDKPSKIDEDLVDHIRDCTSAYYCSQLHVQGGDPVWTDAEGVNYYITISTIKGENFYLGVLPEFKHIQD